MSSTVKWIVGAAVVLVVAGGLWYWLSASPTPPSGVSDNMMPANAASTSGAASGGDTSTAAINQDTAAIDAQMQGLNSDAANVNTSVTSSQSAGQ